MNILVINCHTDNRGDEAAIHALIDELNAVYPTLFITLAIRGVGTQYPNMPENVKMIHQFMPISQKAKIAHKISVLTSGKIVVSVNEHELVNEIKKADMILHAPGGPSIGDTYYEDEPTYLGIYDLLIKMHKPYMFYAPSMGPFEKVERNEWRKKVLKNAKAIVLRDPISAKYVQELVPEKKVYQTLDSAFQHDIDNDLNKKKFDNFTELTNFILNHEKCIGITITDLEWHPIYSKDKDVAVKINVTFREFLKYLIEEGYGIIFIPQLYGQGNDYDSMKSYCQDDKNYFIIPADDERYDTYFQQYLIGRLYAVIGMRYHSNIFSAKMGTPFISISYEQKMKGFMEKMKLTEYCIGLDKLSFFNLKGKFEHLSSNYALYEKYLKEKHSEMKAQSYETTEILKEILSKIMKE